jgi:ferric-dicitrate binding protein FerR (iron transport regulator)
VEVLGTAFNVQDWQKKTQVVLAHGKVRLKAANQQEMTMKPGELAEITDGGSGIEKKEVNPVIYTSWKENKLYCDDTPLAEIADLIQYRYGKKVIFRQAGLREITISGTLPLSDLALLTKVLQESMKINIQTYETEIVISKNEKPAQ